MRHRQFDGCAFDPSRFIIARRYTDKPILFMRRAVWARYNRRARAFGRDVLIEIGFA